MWLVTYRDGLPYHPSSNRARCRATALIETNVLTKTYRVGQKTYVVHN